MPCITCNCYTQGLKRLHIGPQLPPSINLMDTYAHVCIMLRVDTCMECIVKYRKHIKEYTHKPSSCYHGPVS